MDAPDPGKTPFEKARDNVSDVVFEGPVMWNLLDGEYPGNQIQTRLDTQLGYSNGGFATDQNTDVQAWDDADMVELVAWLWVTGFANLDAGDTAGVGIQGGDGGWVGSTSFTDRRVVLGVDVNGDLLLITDDATAATATDTGVDYSDGTWIHVYLRFDKGTEAAASIDGGSEVVVAADLPNQAHTVVMGKDANAAGNVKAAVTGAMWRLTREGL